MTSLRDLLGEHVFDFVPNMEVRHPIDADANGVMFGLEGVCYLAFEDPSDGYRSTCGPLLSFKGEPYQLGGSFWPEHLKRSVLVVESNTTEYGGEAYCISVMDVETGKLLFRVGTDNNDGYYPSFVCQWHPEVLGEVVR